MGKSEIAVFAWRHSAREDQDHAFWINWCKDWGKAWTFQKEKGATGYLHYQGLISLKIRRTEAAAKKIIMDTSILPEYFAPVANPNLKAGTEAFYVTKPDTRVEGPWSDRDREIYIPRQYRGLIDNLLPWQQTIWDRRDNFDSRKINIIIDPQGNRGKSTLASLFDLYGKGIDLPPCNDGEKLIQSVCNILMKTQCRTPGNMFIDLPRSMDQSKLHGLYVAIEQIKKGKVYDFRYSYEQWWFDSPQIWVFCNEAPHTGYVSRDRWVFWTISESGNLTAA